MNGRPEAPLQLRLERLELLALPLERMPVGEVQVNRDDEQIGDLTTND